MTDRPNARRGGLVCRNVLGYESIIVRCHRNFHCYPPAAEALILVRTGDAALAAGTVLVTWGWFCCAGRGAAAASNACSRSAGGRHGACHLGFGIAALVAVAAVVVVVEFGTAADRAA